MNETVHTGIKIKKWYLRGRERSTSQSPKLHRIQIEFKEDLIYYHSYVFSDICQSSFLQHGGNESQITVAEGLTGGRSESWKQEVKAKKFGGREEKGRKFSNIGKHKYVNNQGQEQAERD